MLDSADGDIRLAGADRYSYHLFIGKQRAIAATPIVEALRHSLGQASDMTTHVPWFVTRTLAWHNSPLIAVIEENAQPVAAVLLYGRQQFGIPTGVIKGGNRSGDGLVIAAPDRRAAALEAAIAGVLALPWVHTVLASMKGADLAGEMTSMVPRFDCVWQSREVGTHLSLEGGFEGFLSRLRPRSRRNYRYFRRRGESELGLTFVPRLQPEQAVQAVQDLHAIAMYPVPRARARTLEAVIRGTPGSFAMGVRDAAGQWLSYLSGWRQPEGTFVEWQLNRHDLQAASLSTVMRTYFLEHEAANGVTEVVFVGGTSAALGRYCVPEHCSDLLATRHGVRGRMARGFMTRLHPRGQAALLMRGRAPD